MFAVHDTKKSTMVLKRYINLTLISSMLGVTNKIFNIRFKETELQIVAV